MKVSFKRKIKAYYVNNKIEHERLYEEELNLKNIYPQFATPLTDDEVQKLNRCGRGY